MSPTDHAVKLRQMAQNCRRWAAAYESDTDLLCKMRLKELRFESAALLAGAAALEAVDHLQRFAGAMAEDQSPILHGFAYQIQTIINKHAALARLEEITNAD